MKWQNASVMEIGAMAGAFFETYVVSEIWEGMSAESASKYVDSIEKTRFKLDDKQTTTRREQSAGSTKIKRRFRKKK